MTRIASSRARLIAAGSAAALALGASAALSVAWAHDHGHDAAETSEAVDAASVVVGPAVGDAAPSPLDAADQTGEARTLADLAGAEGLVVYFSRAAAWCPVCQAQMVDINERLDDFFERGYGVAVVTTDTVEGAAGFAAREQIRYPILSDAESEIIRAWDVLDPQFPEGHRGHGLPFPTTYVLGTDGVVDAALYEAEVYGQNGGYRERVSVEAVLAALDGLAAAPVETVIEEAAETPDGDDAY